MRSSELSTRPGPRTGVGEARSRSSGHGSGAERVRVKAGGPARHATLAFLWVGGERSNGRGEAFGSIFFLGFTGQHPRPPIGSVPRHASILPDRLKTKVKKKEED